jgi:hypothetical protein
MLTALFQHIETETIIAREGLEQSVHTTHPPYVTLFFTLAFSVTVMS